ncbi:MAG: DUF1232 domain-containing protein, partial [Selenomonas sp.]|nr:DUF1232 domain-containing protein [Selenomonas sp.]
QPGTPGRLRVLFLLTILFLLSPIDLIPDTVPVVDVLDDAVLVPAAVCALLRLLPLAVRQRSEYEADLLLRHGGAILAVAGLLVLLWLALIIWGICHLFA